MLLSRISLAALAGFMGASFMGASLIGVGTLASTAQEVIAPPATPQEALERRGTLMRQNGQLVRRLSALTGPEAVAAMQTLRDTYRQIPDLFPEGSNIGASEALPEIWKNWDIFTGIAATGLAAAEAGIVAAEAGDAVAYAAAFDTIRGTCGQCHQQFREE